MSLFGVGTITDIERVNANRLPGRPDLILISGTDKGDQTVEMLLSLDAAEALQYALEQALR